MTFGTIYWLTITSACNSKFHLLLHALSSYGDPVDNCYIRDSALEYSADLFGRTLNNPLNYEKSSTSISDIYFLIRNFHNSIEHLELSGTNLHFRGLKCNTCTDIGKNKMFSMLLHWVYS